MNPDRAFTIQTIQLIADTEAQKRYEIDVPIADVPSELVCQWFDDVYKPENGSYREAFTSHELEIFADFNAFYDSLVDHLPETLEEMHRCYAWKQIAGKAEWVLAVLNWEGLNAVPSYS
ncbi:hypothetical protein ACMDCT_01580 [Halomonadaceae bacterium KBTZ08]